MPLVDTGRMYAVTAAVTADTLDPSAKGADIVLSNSNMTLTNSTTNNESVRSIVSHTAGKWYWEWYLNIVPSGGGFNVNYNRMIGVANASFDYAHTQAFDVNAAGLGEDSGSVWVNNVSNNANLFTCAGVGQYGACAVDLDNKLIWFKGQGWGDLWYYSAFPVGPDGGGSGVDISSIVSGPMYMVIGTLGGGAKHR